MRKEKCKSILQDISSCDDIFKLIAAGVAKRSATAIRLAGQEKSENVNSLSR